MTNNFKRKKRNLNNNALPYSDIINLERFTYEGWMAAYPNSNKEEWEKCNNPECLSNFLLNGISRIIYSFHIKDDKDIPKINIIPIGTDYLDWINENNLSNELNSKMEYAETIVGKEKHLELMKKYGWDEDYELRCIPIYVYDSKKPNNNTYTEYKLPEKCKQELLSYLENAHSKGNIFLPGYILKIDEYYNDKPHMMVHAKAYFKENMNLRYGRWNEQHYNDSSTNIYTLCIPFAIRRKYGTTTFGVDELLKVANYFSPFLNYNYENSSDETNHPKYECFSKSKAYTLLSEYFGKDANILAHSVLIDSIPWELKEFVELMEKENKKRNKRKLFRKE